MAVLVEQGTHRRHPLGDRVVLGRGADADLRLDDPMISARHAEVVRTDDGWLVRDLGSRRGTYLGSRRIQEAALVVGDELLLGAVRLRLEDDAGHAPVVVADPGELARLRAVVALGRSLGVQHDLGRIAGHVLDTCLQFLPADRAAMIVYQVPTTAPRLTVRRTRAGDAAPFPLSASVLSEVVATGAPFLGTGTDDAALRSHSVTAQGVRSSLVVPVRRGDGAWLGLLYLDSTAATQVFAATDLELLTAIGGQAALAVENALTVEQLQAARADERDRLARIVRDLPVGVIAVDAANRCVTINRWAAERQAVLGVSPGALVDAVAGVTRAALVASDRPIEVKVGGRTLVLSASGAPDRAELLIVVSDPTDERAREARLSHQDRLTLIGQLAGGVAHDFNNLLMVILGCAGFLEAELQDPEHLDDIRQIALAATQAGELTRQLLTFSRRDLVQPEVVVPAKVIAGMEKLLRHALGARVTLVTRLAPDLPSVLADRAQFEQILMNLLVNARDAMPGGGCASLTVSSEDVGAEAAAIRGLNPGRHLVIEVADTGTGIDPDVLPRLFEPYFTTKPRGKGTGLGLATVHGIVHGAGGDIQVASTAGAGARFRVSLPATTAPSELEGKAAVTRGGGRQTILVVDDEEPVLRVTERMLRHAGYRVLTATSGPAALALVAATTETIDGVVSDLVMPVMSGRELITALALVRPGLAAVLMSGYHEELLDRGVRCVTKPFDRARLLDALAEALGER